MNAESRTFAMCLDQDSNKEMQIEGTALDQRRSIPPAATRAFRAGKWVQERKSTQSGTERARSGSAGRAWPNVSPQAHQTMAITDICEFRRPQSQLSGRLRYKAIPGSLMLFRVKIVCRTRSDDRNRRRSQISIAFWPLDHDWPLRARFRHAAALRRWPLSVHFRLVDHQPVPTPEEADFQVDFPFGVFLMLNS